jgi:hypothetical protein
MLLQLFGTYSTWIWEALLEFQMQHIPSELSATLPTSMGWKHQYLVNHKFGL